MYWNISAAFASSHLYKSTMNEFLGGGNNKQNEQVMR